MEAIITLVISVETVLAKLGNHEVVVPGPCFGMPSLKTTPHKMFTHGVI